MHSTIYMSDEDKEKLRRKKTFALSVKLTLYAVGGGAFGVFARWMQTMLAFDKTGLNTKSVWNVIVPLLILAAGAVFAYLVNGLKQQHYVFPEQTRDIFCREPETIPERPAPKMRFIDPELIRKLIRALLKSLPYLLGLLMLLGGLLMLKDAGETRQPRLMQAVALCAVLGGIGYPILLEQYASKKQSSALMCAASFFPILMYALWLILVYKQNSINSIIWQYGAEILSVCGAMFGFFRIAGFAYDRPDGWRTLFACMFGTFLCILSLADSREAGQQIIFIASAGMQLLCVWLMSVNLQIGVAPEKVKINDGFEHIEY